MNNLIDCAHAIKKQIKCQNTNIIFSEEEIKLELINPNCKDNITIYFQSDEIMFYFAYQHAHFNYSDLGKLVLYTNDFIFNNKVSIEFFKSGKRSFGGSLNYNSVDFSSAESMACAFYPCKETSDWLLELLKCNKYIVKIRCWDSSKNKNIKIRWKQEKFFMDMKK